MCQLVLSFIAALWLLVPLHEALHVWGCLVSGGSVSRLEISAWFGGTLFARIYPWVSSESEYAGRLSGFEPAGDISYLITVLAPHLLLCPIGSAVARAAVSKQRAWLFGIGLAGALQPLASLTGDWYEIASIPITRIGEIAGLSWARKLRGDDVVKMASQAAALSSTWAWVLFAASCIVGVVLAFALLRLSGGIAPRER